MPGSDDISVTGYCGNLDMATVAKVTLAANVASWLD